MSRRTIGPAATPEDLHAIIEDGVNRRDADAIVAAYEDDAMLVVPRGGHLIIGRDNIRAATAQLFALHPEMSLVVVKTVEGDGTAVTYVRWRAAVTSPDGHRRRIAGRGTLVARQRPDGTWGIVLDDLGFARPFRAVHSSMAAGREHRPAARGDVSGSGSTRRVGPARRVS